ncbi:hypothetical protein D9M68_417600 [compost metagenome]
MLRIILLVLEIVLVGLGVVLFRDGLELGLGFRLLRYQPCLELTGQVADFVLAAGTGRGVVRVAQPDPQLQQGCGDVPAEAQAQGQGKGQQDQAEQAHALQADGHGLLELLHVQAQAQVAGDHFLEGDGR